MPIGDAVVCEESELDTVFPQYLTFALNSGTAFGTRGVAFMHKNMSLLKTFVTSKYEAANGTMTRHVKVYEVVKGKAHLLYDLPVGSVKKDSDLWRQKPSKRAIVVDEDEVNEAIESVYRSLGIDPPKEDSDGTD